MSEIPNDFKILLDHISENIGKPIRKIQPKELDSKFYLRIVEQLGSPEISLLGFRESGNSKFLRNTKVNCFFQDGIFHFVAFSQVVTQEFFTNLQKIMELIIRIEKYQSRSVVFYEKRKGPSRKFRNFATLCKHYGGNGEYKFIFATKPEITMQNGKQVKRLRISKKITQENLEKFQNLYSENENYLGVQILAIS